MLPFEKITPQNQCFPMKRNLFRAGFAGLLMLGFLSESFAVSRYVDGSATGANNGTNWANAYTSLEDAVADAHNNLAIDTILVAQGTYFPVTAAGAGGDARDRTFLFTRDGLAVLGGYPSGGGQRDVANNITLLNGDLGTANDNTDNALHIMVALGTATQAIDATLVIDGFTFINGNADISSGNTINGMNAARSNGAAIYTYYSGLTISNCTFKDNDAVYGGAISAQESTAIISDCIFKNNSASINGGAIDNVSSGLKIKNVVLTDNVAGNGGAIAFHSATTPFVHNAVFAGNTSTAWGGAVYNNISSPEFVNCLFYGNTAPTGAALANYLDAAPVLINTTIAGNNGGFAGAMYNATNVEVTLTNCIVYGNNSGILNDATSAYSHFYSLVQDDASMDFGNLNGYTTDPLFVNAPSYFTAPFSSGADYHLQNSSPCINVGDNSGIPAGMLYDLAGNDRITESVVDMGPYEKVVGVSCNLEIAINSTDITCFDAATGLIEVSVTGGTAPYQYAINDQPLGENNVFEDLTAGTYLIVVADNAGCTNELEVTLTQPASALQFTTTVTQPACFDAATGLIDVSVTGGTAPYQYAINDQPLGENNVFEGLAAGTYLIVVADNAGCVSELEVTLTQPASALQSTATITQPACLGATDGAIAVSVSGGTAPYTYLWSNEAVTSAINNLAEGTYTLITTDENGCQLYDTFHIAYSGEVFSVDLGPDRTLCAEQAATLVVDVEMEDATYAWSSNNGFASSAAQVTVSNPGIYTVTVTTPEGCTASDSIAIAVSEGTVSADFIVATQGFLDSVITLVNITDPQPDSIRWILPSSCSVISRQSSYAEISFADTGVYEVGMRAFMGECYEDKISQVIIVEASLDEMPDVPRYPFIKKYLAYPNPSNGNFSVDIELQKEVHVNLTLIDATTGVLVDMRQESAPKEATIQYNLSLDTGTYILLLETPYGFRSIKIEIL